MAWAQATSPLVVVHLWYAIQSLSKRYLWLVEAEQAFGGGGGTLLKGGETYLESTLSEEV